MRIIATIPPGETASEHDVEAWDCPCDPGVRTDAEAGVRYISHHTRYPLEDDRPRHYR
jgi:hypothetical protein